MGEIDDYYFDYEMLVSDEYATTPRAGKGWWKPRIGNKVRIKNLGNDHLKSILRFKWLKESDFEKYFELIEEASNRWMRIK